MELLGKSLREAREAKGLSTKEVAEATRIKVQIIENLEEDDFSRIAAPIYGKGFIKLYAEHLGLDAAPLIASYVEATNSGSLSRKPRHKPVAADTRPEGEKGPSRWGGMRKAPDKPLSTESETGGVEPSKEPALQNEPARKEEPAPAGELDLGLADTAPEEETRRLFADFNMEAEAPAAREPMVEEPDVLAETVVQMPPPTEPLPELEYSADEDWSAALEKELQAVGPVTLPMDDEPGIPETSASERPARKGTLLSRLASALSPQNANEDPVKYAGILAAVILVAIFLISGVSRIFRPGQPGGEGGPVSPGLKLAIEAPSPYLGENAAE